MPTAEIIAIGTELLLGEINDTNTRYLARQLRDCGIDLFRSTIIGDNLQRITALMQEALQRAEIVITTGGLGPTVDDPTRDAAALAFNTQNEFHPELWEQICKRFLSRAMNISENNKKQAYIPFGAYVIENPVGTAPSFILNKDGKTLVCLPGVPREMEYLMQSAVIPWLKEHYPLAGVIKARVLHVGALSESKVDEMIDDLEKMTNPSVGLLAHPGIVDIRITAKAESDEVADRMITGIETIVRQRLSDQIYGVDGETQCHSIISIVDKLQYPIAVQLSGFSPASFADLNHKNILKITSSLPVENQITNNKYPVVFDFKYQNTPEKAILDLVFKHNEYQEFITREYMGASGLREEWAKNYSLSFMWRLLISKGYPEENYDQS